MKKYSGIYTALLTPIKDGKINEAALAALVKHNIEMGVAGFYVTGSTGEALMLTVEERMQIMRIVKENAEGRYLIAHVGSLNERDAIRLAAYAKELSYDMVSSVAPYYYKFSFEEIWGYYCRIADAADLPMLVYHIPAFSGVSMGVSEISAFLDDERFAGIKFTSGDFFTMQRIRAAYPDKLIFNGYDEMLLSGLAMGADGAIGSTYNFMADKFVAMRESFLSGNIEEASRLQTEANRIISLLCGMGVMQGEKEIMNQLGLDFGGCVPPLAPLDEQQRKVVKDEIIPYIRALE